MPLHHLALTASTLQSRDWRAPGSMEPPSFQDWFDNLERLESERKQDFENDGTSAHRSSCHKPDSVSEIALQSLEDVKKQDLLQLLQDSAALFDACHKLGCVTEQECKVIAGTRVRILEADPSDNTVKCRVPQLGEVWFTVNSFASGETATSEGGCGLLQRGERATSLRVNGGFSCAAQEAGRCAVGAASASLAGGGAGIDRAAVFAANAATVGTSEAAEETARAEAAAATAAAAAAATAAADVHTKAQQRRSHASGLTAARAAAKEATVSSSFPVGKGVKVLQPIVMRICEDPTSRETAKLAKGRECLVLAHGTETSNRRLLVRDMDTGSEGWISCATKTGRALVELLKGAPAASENALSVPDDVVLRMPTIEEVLAHIDEDEIGARAQEHGDESRKHDIVQDEANARREEAEEAFAVWQCFSDLARTDDIISADPCNTDTMPELPAVFRDCMAPDAQEVMQAQDLQLRLLARDRERKVARKQQMREKFRDALAPKTKLMPKVRGICSRSTGSDTQAEGAGHGCLGSAGLTHASQASHFSPSKSSVSSSSAWLAPTTARSQSSACQPQHAVLQGIEELRQQLDEERRQLREEAVEEHRTLEQSGIALAPSMDVHVHGLKSAPELNGIQGTLQRWDAESSRWIVRFEGGKCKKLRPQNLIPLDIVEVSSQVAMHSGHAHLPACDGEFISPAAHPDGAGNKHNEASNRKSWSCGVPESRAHMKSQSKSEDMMAFPPSSTKQSRPSDAGVFGTVPFGQPSDSAESCPAKSTKHGLDIPGLNDLLRQLDVDDCAGAVQPGDKEYWVRLGLASTR